LNQKKPGSEQLMHNQRTAATRCLIGVSIRARGRGTCARIKVPFSIYSFKARRTEISQQ